MLSTQRLTILACSLVIATCAAFVPLAHADGDPASDILLYQNGYLPYGGVLPAQLAANVQQVVANASDANFPVKLAVIASQNDLGAVASMFGQPQQYASFLAKELAVGPTTSRPHAPGVLERGRAAAKIAAKSPLLVVMPNGYGVAGPVSAHARGVLERTPLNVKDGTALGQAAVDGVVKLAKAEGKQVSAPPNPLADTGSEPSPALPQAPTPAHGRTSSSTPWAPIAVGVAALVLFSIAALWWRARERRSHVA
jgi:hypothetical protein